MSRILTRKKKSHCPGTTRQQITCCREMSRQIICITVYNLVMNKLLNAAFLIEKKKKFVYFQFKHVLHMNLSTRKSSSLKMFYRVFPHHENKCNWPTEVKFPGYSHVLSIHYLFKLFLSCIKYSGHGYSRHNF